MITVDNDPEAIKAYRGKIQSLIEDLRRQLKKTGTAIQTVSESWKDSNFMEFQTSFNADKEPIKRLITVLEQYESNILFQLETKLRAYKGGPTHL